jgi:cell division protein FtsB
MGLLELLGSIPTNANLRLKVAELEREVAALESESAALKSENEKLRLQFWSTKSR